MLACLNFFISARDSEGYSKGMYKWELTFTELNLTFAFTAILFCLQKMIILHPKYKFGLQNGHPRHAMKWGINSLSRSRINYIIREISILSLKKKTMDCHNFQHFICLPPWTWKIAENTEKKISNHLYRGPKKCSNFYS